MKYDIISLGNGRLSGACRTDEGNIVVVQRNGALHKLLIKDRTVSDLGVIGYGIDCYVFPEGTVFFDPEVKFEADS